MSQFSVKLWDLLLDDNVLARLPQLVISKKFLEENFFMGRNFCKLVFDCENHENFDLPSKNFWLYGIYMVVNLHIGVGHSWTPMCKTTPQGGM